MNNLLAVLNGAENGIGDGALVSVMAIALVFGILALIIGITYAVNYIIQRTAKPQPAATSQTESVQPKTVNIDSEEAEIAVLVASIDYRNEIKKDIKVVSVKEIK